MNPWYYQRVFGGQKQVAGQEKQDFTKILRQTCLALQRRLELEGPYVPMVTGHVEKRRALVEVIEPPPEPVGPLPSDLKALAEIVARCRRCRLHAGRTNPVFGEGPLRCDVMFVGEGPGAEEDAVGRPFVGPAGRLLDRMIAAMGMRREDCYISNVVKCRPPFNATPKPDEAGACAPFLQKQIEIVRPRILVALGGSAAAVLTGKQQTVSSLRGAWYHFKVSEEGQLDKEKQDDIPVLVTYHPAALLRNPALKPQAWQDLKLVLARLGRPVPGVTGKGGKV